jgi:hypothetical protein
MFNFFKKKIKRAKIDALQQVNKTIDIKLQTFTNHLKQLSTVDEAIIGSIESLRRDHQEIIKLLKEKKKNGT